MSKIWKMLGIGMLIAAIAASATAFGYQNATYANPIENQTFSKKHTTCLGMQR